MYVHLGIGPCELTVVAPAEICCLWGAQPVHCSHPISTWLAWSKDRHGRSFKMDLLAV